jgi:hypothetical protein
MAGSGTGNLITPSLRTTAGAVGLIIDVDPNISLTPFMVAANALVTEICASATTTSGASYYTATRLELIERWLSAYFYAVRDPTSVPTQESVASSVAASYQHREDLGFDSNHYGQMAMRLDTNGGLARLNRQAKKGKSRITIQYLGTENEDPLGAVY